MCDNNVSEFSTNVPNARLQSTLLRKQASEAVMEYIEKNAKSILQELKEINMALDRYFNSIGSIQVTPNLYHSEVFQYCPKCQALEKLSSIVKGIGEHALGKFVGALGSFKCGQYMADEVISPHIDSGRKMNEGLLIKDCLLYIEAARKHVYYLMHEIERIRDAQNYSCKSIILTAMLV